ncbi:MAG: transposase family protein [Candidatus Methanomethylicaceae archaeon]
MSLLSCLQQIHDPRSRHRREYPLHGLLAILILAAAHGETSLRGMWQWGKKRASLLMNFFPLGLWAKARFPSLGTFWYLLSKIPPGACEQALAGWCVSGEESYALDGKTLRGSKRAEEGALRVVTLVGHRFRQELAQREAEGGG